MKGNRVDYYAAGRCVREQRNRLKLTQHQVCRGLCTKESLSRFENGEQTLSRDCVEALIQRLSLPDDLLAAAVTIEEIRLVRLYKEIVAASYRAEIETKREREKWVGEAKKKISEMKGIVRKDDHIHQQFIMEREATIKGLIADVDPVTKYELLEKALLLTAEDYSPEAIKSSVFTNIEIGIIMEMSVCLYEQERYTEACDLLQRLLLCMETFYPEHIFKADVIYNYALCLWKKGQYFMSISACEEGLNFCNETEHYLKIGRFTHLQAECLSCIGDTKGADWKRESARYIYNALGDHFNAEALAQDS